MVDLGLARPATEKLETLESGNWEPPGKLDAASKSQSKSLKVPLSGTRFGQDHWILWQIEIGLDDDMEALQQTIKGQLLPHHI